MDRNEQNLVKNCLILGKNGQNLADFWNRDPVALIPVFRYWEIGRDPGIPVLRDPGC